MFLFQSNYKYKHLKMYKNKKGCFLHLTKADQTYFYMYNPFSEKA